MGERPVTYESCGFENGCPVTSLEFRNIGSFVDRCAPPLNRVQDSLDVWIPPGLVPGLSPSAHADFQRLLLRSDAAGASYRYNVRDIRMQLHISYITQP